MAKLRPLTCCIACGRDTRNNSRICRTCVADEVLPPTHADLAAAYEDGDDHRPHELAALLDLLECRAA